MTGLRQTVYLGSSMADVPPENELVGKIEVPVLLTATKGDTAHPTESAVWMNDLVPGSELHVFPSKKALNDLEFQPYVQRFLLDLDRTVAHA